MSIVIVVDTCELHSAFDGQCFGCVVASFHAQCRCISDLRDRVQKLEGVADEAGKYVALHHGSCMTALAAEAEPCALCKAIVAYRRATEALSPNGTEGGGNG